VEVEQDDLTAAERMAVRLLAGREHSRHELERKLGVRFADQDVVGVVLDDLERRRLLSDERFAESYVDQRRRKGYGPLRIRAELSDRGIAGALAARWLDDGPFDWGDTLEQAATRKFGEQPAADMRSLAKRARFLAQRGFPQGMIRHYLDRARGF
jgi:regulatory protein